MGLKQVADVPLPPHIRTGGFDHAAVHGARSRLYVAHTANDAIDVIDCATHRYLHSIGGLTAVAGALVSEHDDLVFTSNRGENTVGMLRGGDDSKVVKIPVGIRPNGLAYDSRHRILLAANVGDPSVARSFTVSIVDTAATAMVADIEVPGRTRWAVFDPVGGLFYVNIMDPPSIAVIDAGPRLRLAHVIPIPVAGAHGLDLDTARRTVFCACDGGKLLAVSVDSGTITASADLSGVPDVVFLNPVLQRIYVAIGEPGVIDVFEAAGLRRLETMRTERGAHTIGFDPVRQTVYAFLPESHRAVVFADQR